MSMLVFAIGCNQTDLVQRLCTRGVTPGSNPLAQIPVVPGQGNHVRSIPAKMRKTSVAWVVGS